MSVGIAATLSPVLPVAADAAPAAATLTVSTSTTLTASSASVSRDSWVTFSVRVRASQGIPAGSVTFTDVSNGSVLGTARLSSGGMRFSTAALAPGTRHIVARYGGSGTFAASSSAALAISVAPAGSEAVAYQIDPRHDGYQAGGRLTARSLTKRWSVTLGATGGATSGAGDVSYPLIAGGRVFVTVPHTEGYGSDLYALNAGTGAVDWSVSLDGTYGFSALAYDGRRVFAINWDGVLTAFAASTGRELWAVKLSHLIAVTAPPTAYDGVVYAAGATSGGTLYAVSEADGVTRWDAAVQNGDSSSPAVDGSGVYVSYAAQQDYRFSLRGHLVWHYAPGPEGGGGSTAVLHGRYVYARGRSDPPVILSRSSGTLVGSFSSATAPAFGGTDMYTLQGGNLVAVDPSGGPNRWTFGDGTLVTAPVFNDGVVYAGSSTGTVYGVSAASGARVWSGTAGSTIVGPYQPNTDVLTGPAIGGGLLVVPAGNQLTAFGD